MNTSLGRYFREGKIDRLACSISNGNHVCGHVRRWDREVKTWDNFTWCGNCIIVEASSNHFRGSQYKLCDCTQFLDCQPGNVKLVRTPIFNPLNTGCCYRGQKYIECWGIRVLRAKFSFLILPFLFLFLNNHKSFFYIYKSYKDSCPLIGWVAFIILTIYSICWKNIPLHSVWLANISM